MGELMAKEKIRKTKKSKRKGGGGKLSRTQTVTVRLDPKLKFGAELAARKQRRTLSSFIEWSLHQAIEAIQFGVSDSEKGIKFVDFIWDTSEAYRFAKLAFNYPGLMTYDEEVIWGFIRTYGFLWRGNFSPNVENSELVWSWECKDENLMYNRLEKFWEEIKLTAMGQPIEGKLPTWESTRPMPEN